MLYRKLRGIEERRGEESASGDNSSGREKGGSGAEKRKEKERDRKRTLPNMMSV